MSDSDFSLIPAIIQDIKTKEVLMLGYMNNEALKKTLEGPNVWFYSRSRKKLWEKGETSGNHLIVKKITTDCDKDTLIIQAEPSGPSCHTGKNSCFHQSELKKLVWQNPNIFSDIFNIIEDRKNNPKEKSYTNSLLADKKLCVSKVKEEINELIESVEKDTNKIHEAADVMYHLLVYLEANEINIEHVMEELNKRKK